MNQLKISQVAPPALPICNGTGREVVYYMDDTPYSKTNGSPIGVGYMKALWNEFYA